MSQGLSAIFSGGGRYRSMCRQRNIGKTCTSREPQPQMMPRHDGIRHERQALSSACSNQFARSETIQYALAVTVVQVKKINYVKVVIHLGAAEVEVELPAVGVGSARQRRE